MDLATPWIMRREQARVPLDVSHLPERFGLFIILILGETIAAVILGITTTGWSAAATLAAILGVGTAVGMWWMYFDNVEGAVVRRRDSGGRSWRPTAWIYSHFLLAAGVGLAGVGLEHAVINASRGHLGAADRWLITGSLGIVFAAMALIHFATVSTRSPRIHTRIARNRVLGIPLLLVLGTFSFLGSGWLLLLVTLVCILEVLADMVMSAE